MSSPVPARPWWDNGYPTTEGPTPETDRHRNLMLALIASLLHYFGSTRRRAYVSGNILVHYEEGNRRRHVSPDVFVARGVEQRERPNYLIWEEAAGPEFVIELASPSTSEIDRTRKLRLYREALRVREYFQFDPQGGLHEPRLQGVRLVGDDYVPIDPVAGRLPSLVTGLHLEQAGDDLRLWDPATGAWVPTDAERAEQEAARANAAEERLRELEAELARRGTA